MGMKLLDYPDLVERHQKAHGFFDDFNFYTTVHNGWTTVASDSGTIVGSDAAGGVLALNPSDGTVTDNDEIYLKRTQETFKFAQDKSIYFGVYAKFSEANTDDANVFFGLKDAIAANTIVDNGGMATSFSGVGFYKKDGETYWRIIASLGSTQTEVLLNSTNSADKLAKTAGNGSYQKLEILVAPISSSLAEIVFRIDNVDVYKISEFTFTSATEMQAGCGMKNGADTNVETLYIDWITAWQTR